LASHLLGIGSESDLSRSPFLGPLFEGFVASEIVKQQLNMGHRKELYYFRDQQGLEVDFVVPTGPQALAFIEAKASRTVTPRWRIRSCACGTRSGRYDVTSFVVHRGAGPEAALTAPPTRREGGHTRGPCLRAGRPRRP
jgi:hypothetical protein